VIVPPDRGEKPAGRDTVVLGIRPEDITQADVGVPGEIFIVEPLGRDDLITVRIGEVNVHVLADPTLNLKMGQTIRLKFNTHKVQFFDPQTEQSLLWMG
jgi:ABC-type sugar transport system ATPase subunit